MSETPSMQTGLRARKREATRVAISQAAMRLFDRRGYDDVTVDEIAAECEVSPRTFFRYFRAKEDVLFADGEVRRAALLESLAAQPADTTPFEAIAAASRALVERYVDDADLLRARARVIDASPSLKPRDAELPKRWDADVLDFVRNGGRAKGYTDLELRLEVGTAMTAFRVAIESWLATDGDLAELVDVAFRRLGTGLARIPRT